MSYWTEAIPACFPKWLHTIIVPPAVYEDYNLSPYSPTLDIACSYESSIPVQEKWNQTVADSISFLYSDVEYFYMFSGHFPF